MNPFAARLSALLAVVLVGSASSVLFGTSDPYVAIVLSLSLSLSISIGFRRALPMSAALGFLSDIVLLGVPGLLASFSVMLCYAAGFASRRLMTEHGIFLSLSAGSAVSVSLIAFRAFSSLFGGDFNGRISSLLFLFCLGMVVFPTTKWFFDRFSFFSETCSVPGPIR